MTARRHTGTCHIGALVVFTAIAAACSSTAPSSSSSTSRPSVPATTAAAVLPVPGAAWPTATPASVGLDAAKLQQIAIAAEQGKSNCLAVERDGRIAGSWYFHGTNALTAQDIFSATKSVASVLVGIAQDDGDLNINDPASKWITEWKGTPSENVTIRDILSGDSGRAWSPTIDYVGLIAAPDRTAYAIGLKQAEPRGTVWAYNNSADQTLERVLKEATGEDVATFAKQRLFDPIGMTHTAMTRDRAGNPQLFEGVHSTCEDLARFGLLMLDHGRWGSKQIVSAAWVAASTGPSSTKLNAAYGYLWWVNHEGLIGSPLVATNLKAAADPTKMHGRVVAGAPDDIFWALGLGDQLVQVDPGSGTVVVRLGSAQRPGPTTFGPAQASKVVTEAVVGK